MSMALCCANRKNRNFEKPAQNTNELLEEIGGFRDAYTCTVVLCTAAMWLAAALATLAPAFISPFEKNKSDPPFVTVQDEFNLTSSWFNPAEWTGSMVFVGNLLFGQILGIASEVFGRSSVISFACIAVGCTGIATSFAPTFGWLLFGRFMTGVFLTPVFIINYLHAIECLPFESHSTCLIIYGLFWLSGYFLISAMALLFPTWRTFTLVSSIPIFIFGIVLLLFLPDSLSFLIAQKKENKIKRYLSMVERFSKKRLRYDLQAILYSDVKEEQKITLAIILRSAFKREILVLIAIATFLWTASTIIYNSMSLSSVILNVGSNHVQFILSGVAELPSYFVAPILIDKFGRRATTIWNFVILGAFLILLGMLQIAGIGTTYYFLAFWLLTKLCISAVFMYLFVYTTEIFPIHCRSFALALCIMLSNFGAIISPHAPALDVIYPGTMYFAFAALCMITTVCTSYLPETKHTHQSGLHD